MRARTEMKGGVVFFAYTDWYGVRFRSYDELVKNGSGRLYLVGYFRSGYYGCTEPIDDIELKERPTRAMVEKFIRDCKHFIEQD